MISAGSGKNFISVIVGLLGGLGVMSAPLQIWLKNTHQRIRENLTIKITVISPGYLLCLGLLPNKYVQDGQDGKQFLRSQCHQIW